MKLMNNWIFKSILKQKSFVNWKYYSSEKVNESTKNKYMSVIGLEVHAQIDSNAKLFSSAGTSFVSPVNSQVDLFDMALPGTLPILNKRCVEAAVLTSLALNSEIAKISSFDRKHYFYADMPAGYQITQQRNPIATQGFIDFIVYKNDFEKSYMKRCNLKQIQIEQDSGKSLQDLENNRSLVDLNRAGIGLLEFVFEPDLTNEDEAVCLVKELILILKRIQVCTCKMNEGALRVDANISVNQLGQPYGIRTEIKNLNSFRFMKEALKYEIQRQIYELEKGNQIINETRMYDNKRRQTIAMRDKEVVQDYRFMPEPNLPPIYLSDHKDNNDPSLINILAIKERITVLPEFDRKVLLEKYSLDLSQIFTLINDSAMMQLFENIMDLFNSKENVNEIYKFIHSDLRTVLENKNSSFEDCLDDCQRIYTVIQMLLNNEISMGTAYDVTELLFQDKRSPKEIVETYGWKMICDQDKLKQLCLEAVLANEKIAKKYMRKKVKRPKSVMVHHVLKAINNRANEEEIWNMIDHILFVEKIFQNDKYIDPKSEN